MRISFLGDIMCEKPLQKELLHGKVNEETGYNIKKYYNSNFVIGNLETVFAGKQKKYTNDIYSFNTPDFFCNLLKSLSVDCVTTANNHCLDRGIEGLTRTLKILDQYNIKHVGTRGQKTDEPAFITSIEGKKIGVLSYTYGTNYSLNKVRIEKADWHVNMLKSNYSNIVEPQGYINTLKEKLLKKEIRVRVKKALGLEYNKERTDTIQVGDFDQFYLDKIKQEIQQIRKKVDYLFAYLHTGGQFNLNPGEYSKEICHFFYKQGVNFVVASHPHVVQQIECMKDGLIAYSLGNFLISPSSVYLLNTNMPTLSLILHFDILDGKVICNFSIARVYIESHKTYIRDCYNLYQCAEGYEKKCEIEEMCRHIYGVVFPQKRHNKFKISKEYFVGEYQL